MLEEHKEICVEKSKYVEAKLTEERLGQLKTQLQSLKLQHLDDSQRAEVLPSIEN